MLISVAGKPNCGKSTFFKAATQMDVAIGNRPFVTVKSNEGIAYVRIPCVDSELNTQCNPRFGSCIHHQRFIPLRFMDIPGLAVGAHEGRGLGYEFLNDIGQADALIHVVDIAGSTNENGEPVPVGSYDPLQDIAFLETELDYWYHGILAKSWEKFARKLVGEKKKLTQILTQQYSGLRITEKHVQHALQNLQLDAEHPDQWKVEDVKKFCSALRKYSKPLVIAANKIDKGGEENLQRLQQQFPHLTIIPCSADAELALREAQKQGIIDYIPGDNSFTITKEISAEQKKVLDFIQKQVLGKFGSTGVQQALNQAVFDLLGYIAVYPGGVGKLEDSEGRRLPDCFLLPPGSTALDFAYKIHKDLGDNFVKAIDVKTKMPLGKDHQLKHRDIIEIKT
ncbi:MAG: redox-regulated ATPase YchF [Nanoarchaeota archaeon]